VKVEGDVSANFCFIGIFFWKGFASSGYLSATEPVSKLLGIKDVPEF
jgi:hypothetical protein